MKPSCSIPSGYVAECTGENIFVVRNGVIYTVPRGSILEGITRDSLITLAGDMGYTVVEEPISRDQLYIADEVFVCGTAAEVIGLARDRLPHHRQRKDWAGHARVSEGV